MIKAIQHFEAYLTIEIARKYKALGLIFLAMMIAGNTRYFFVFFLITKLLPYDVHRNTLKNILWLPFSRVETFIFSFFFGLFLAFFSGTMGNIFFFGHADLSLLIEISIFYSAYFGILMLVTTKGVDNVTFPILFLIADLIAGSIGDPAINKYQLYSPLYHKSYTHSFSVAAVILIVSFVVYISDRREKWR